MSRCRVMFSSTTIESSTKIPMVKPRPIIEIRSTVMPITRMTMNVASSETGIEIMTTTALRHACRKSSMTIAVKKMPSTRLCSTPLIEALV